MTERSIKIYDVAGEERSEFVRPVNGDDLDRFDALDGTPQAARWQPVDVKIIREDEGKPLQESDSPWLGFHVLVFRPSTVRALGSLLLSQGELLPLRCATESLVAFNPTNRLEALDEERSRIKRFPDGRVMFIDEYCFRPEVIGNAIAFKIPNRRVSPIFVTQELVDAWRKHGLRGLDFKLLWEGHRRHGP